MDDQTGRTRTTSARSRRRPEGARVATRIRDGILQAALLQAASLRGAADRLERAAGRRDFESLAEISLSSGWTVDQIRGAATVVARQDAQAPDGETVRDSRAWICGFATALAELHRRQESSTSVCEVARDAGVTLERAREAGVEPFDLRELRKAGIPACSTSPLTEEPRP